MRRSKFIKWLSVSDAASVCEADVAKSVHPMTVSRRLPALVLTGVLSCFVVFGASDAVALKHKRRPHHSPAVPAGPSLTTLQRLQCAKYSCDANTKVTKLRILKRGPVQAVGYTRLYRWVYPILMSYDETVTTGHFTGGGYAPLVWVTDTQTTHTREKDNVQRDSTGAFVLRFVASSSTCAPNTNGCTASVGGGA
jgi:hypothetical protein